MGAGESGSASLSCGGETERKERNEEMFKGSRNENSKQKKRRNNEREKSLSGPLGREREAERQVRGRKQEDAPGLRSQIKREPRERASEPLHICVTHRLRPRSTSQQLWELSTNICCTHTVTQYNTHTSLCG